jgi:hypothetical protein
MPEPDHSLVHAGVRIGHDIEPPPDEDAVVVVGSELRFCRLDRARREELFDEVSGFGLAQALDHARIRCEGESSEHVGQSRSVCHWVDFALTPVNPR